jgi:hypothetical protein
VVFCPGHEHAVASIPNAFWSIAANQTATHSKELRGSGHVELRLQVKKYMKQEVQPLLCTAKERIMIWRGRRRGSRVRCVCCDGSCKTVNIKCLVAHQKGCRQLLLLGGHGIAAMARPLLGCGAGHFCEFNAAIAAWCLASLQAGKDRSFICNLEKHAMYRA